MNSNKNTPADTIEETKAGGKAAYGTHNYPDHLTHIDKVTWDVVVVGAGPAGLMMTVSVHRLLLNATIIADKNPFCRALWLALEDMMS
jgi:ribulose 1,5-bisphosphate synthetase/thiazole synthase